MIKSLITCAALAFSGVAQSAVVTINLRVDPLVYTPTGVYSFEKNLEENVFLTTGDTLQINVSFAGGQRLVLDHRLEGMGVGIGSRERPLLITTTSNFVLLEPTGPLVEQGVSPQIDGFSQQGISTYYPAPNAPRNTAVSFLGYQQTITIDRQRELSAGFPETTLGRNYDRVAFYYISYIPEPATWGMMISGFALIGSSLRRQRERRSSTPLRP